MTMPLNNCSGISERSITPARASGVIGARSSRDSDVPSNTFCPASIKHRVAPESHRGFSPLWPWHGAPQPLLPVSVESASSVPPWHRCGGFLSSLGTAIRIQAGIYSTAEGDAAGARALRTIKAAKVSQPIFWQNFSKLKTRT